MLPSAGARKPAKNPASDRIPRSLSGKLGEPLPNILARYKFRLVTLAFICKYSMKTFFDGLLLRATASQPRSAKVEEADFIQQ